MHTHLCEHHLSLAALLSENLLLIISPSLCISHAACFSLFFCSSVQLSPSLSLLCILHARSLRPESARALTWILIAPSCTSTDHLLAARRESWRQRRVEPIVENLPAWWSMRPAFLIISYWKTESKTYIFHNNPHFSYSFGCGELEKDF